MENIIRIKGAVFYAYHGVMTEEQSVGGKFEADVDLYTDFTGAAYEDSLRQTVDYQKVYKFIHQYVHEHKYRLIESLAMKIADEILIKFEQVNKVAIRVRKNNAPLGGLVDYVEVEIIKTRDELNSNRRVKDK